ncbi:unnamed protein product [Pipistrellus nathusii]|uniref:Uncharacterized protein n=1 Tax=Pipistrellus nathusii TaxID=59473 RepID=A0ABN9ZRQ0_PIPNA
MSCFLVTPGPFASDPCSLPIHSPSFLHSAGDPFTLSSCHCQSLIPIEESRLEPVTAVEGSLAVVGEQCLAPPYWFPLGWLVGDFCCIQHRGRWMEMGILRENLRNGAHSFHSP